jgi:hypothetical protein
MSLSALARRKSGRGLEVCEAAFFLLDFFRPFVSRQKDKKKADTFNGAQVVMNFQVKRRVQT